MHGKKIKHAAYDCENFDPADTAGLPPGWQYFSHEDSDTVHDGIVYYVVCNGDTSDSYITVIRPIGSKTRYHVEIFDKKKHYNAVVVYSVHRDVLAKFLTSAIPALRMGLIDYNKED
jgi:hypothetical protein